MNSAGKQSSTASSKDGRKRDGKVKKYFSVSDDYSILTTVKTKGVIVSNNELMQDLAIQIDREPESIKERYKKLNSLSDEDKELIINYVKVVSFYKNRVGNPVESWVFFEKGNSRKIEMIDIIKPSLRHTSLKTIRDEPLGEEEQINKFLNNDEFDEQLKLDMYQKTINLPLEHKLKMNKKPNSLEEALGSDIILLGKREETEEELNHYDVESRKHLREEGIPFGSLNQNTLEADLESRRNGLMTMPKFDPEKKIVLTPNNKEEEESNNSFLEQMLENLAKANGMKPQEVLQFAIQLPAKSFNFETIHKELQKFKTKKEGLEKVMKKDVQKKSIKPKVKSEESTTEPIR